MSDGAKRGPSVNEPEKVSRAIVCVGVLAERSTANVTLPVGVPGPVRASWKTEEGDPTKTTTPEKVTVIDVTIDRCGEPSLTCTPDTCAWATALTVTAIVCVARPPMSLVTVTV